eukprot:3764942-Pleurochrysis_carterae.AAC.1
MAVFGMLHVTWKSSESYMGWAALGGAWLRSLAGRETECSCVRQRRLYLDAPGVVEEARELAVGRLRQVRRQRAGGEGRRALDHASLSR